MSFRSRLIAFLIATLVVVQSLTAIVGYGVMRQDAIGRGKQELSNAVDAFKRQWDVFSRRVTDDVQVLSLDYALRQAIAQHDYETEFSALRNHGNRVGATRMMLVDLDGKVTADTASDAKAGTFPFGDILDEAALHDKGASVATLDGHVYWIVAVPVKAPVPIAFIVACVPINDALLGDLRALSSTPRAVALATSESGHWNVVAKSNDFALDADALPIRATEEKSTEVKKSKGQEFMAMSAQLSSAAQSAPIAVVFTFPLSEVLGAYGSLTKGMLVVMAVALLVALLGALVIAHSVSKPLEKLAATARRIASGDYTPAPKVGGRDEIGQLSDGLNAMSQSISERESALTGAIDGLETARAQAVRANEAKSQFLANMSHELRTPLNAILGFGEMLQHQVLGPLGVPKYADYATDICNSGKSLMTIVSHMLELSAAEAGRLEIAHAPVDSFSLVNDSLAAQRHIAKKAKVDLMLKADFESWPVIEGDAAKLKHAFTNLIHNAIKYTPTGGRVTVAADVTGECLRVAFSDTGVGIAPEDIPIVTRPFHTLRSALDAKYQGAGLGLSFSKAIVEGHGGTLTLDSAVGQGTTVTVELPMGASAQGNFHKAA